MLAVLAVFLVYLAAVPVSVAVVAEGGVRVGASIFLPGAAVRSARPISGKPKKKKRTDLPLAVRASIAFLKRLRPMEMRVTGRIGLDDAAQTALVCGMRASLNAIPRARICIQPDFSAPRFAVSGILSARAGNLMLAALSGAGTLLAGRIRTWKSIRSKA